MAQNGTCGQELCSAEAVVQCTNCSLPLCADDAKRVGMAALCRACLVALQFIVKPKESAA